MNKWEIELKEHRGQTCDRAVRASRKIASLLQLDLIGAYDTVDHLHLLNTLREMGFPPGIIRWIRSYLTDRTATLQFDGESSDIFHLQAGVPQGSPLSPVLFLLYITSLYERLRTEQGIILVGFSDDTNILSIGRNPETTIKQLEAAWKICEE